MSLMDFLAVVSLIVGLISIAFSFFVWNASKNFENRVTQSLNSIDKNADLIKQSVENSQEKLLTTVTSLAMQSAKNNDPEKQMQTQLLSDIFSNPEKLGTMLDLMQKFPNFNNQK